MHFILLFVLPPKFLRSGTDNVTVHAQVCGLFCVLFMILCDFIKAKAMDLGVLPMIVHPALHRRRHCFFAMLSGFMETVNSQSFVTRLVALSFRQYRGFSPSGSCHLPIDKEKDRDQCSVSLS